MRWIFELCCFLVVLGVGYLIILGLENQILYGIYFSLEGLYNYTGWFAFVLLFVGLWLPNPLGKIFGILAFVGVCWHLMIFVHLDFGLDLKLAVQKILFEKPLIVGSLGFLLMGCAFLVSLLGVFRVFKMHVLVYVSLILSLAHILMLQKVLDGFYYAMFGLVLCALAFKIWRLVRKV